jgi:uncharacterized protein YjbJ (UPF0337 family)
MEWNRIEGNWTKFMAAAKSRWEKLTEEQLLVVAGRREWLAGSIQESYGITREASHRQIDQWQADQKLTQGEDETGERLAGSADRK